MSYIDCEKCIHYQVCCGYTSKEAIAESNRAMNNGESLLCFMYAPTADVVEVVRCKECKYYTEHYQGTYGEYGRCDHPQQDYEIECFDMWVETNPDDYCSYGERRTE